MKDNYKSFIFLRAVNVGLPLLFFLMLPFQIFSMELFSEHRHIHTVRKFTVHTWEFVHGSQKRENTTLTSGSHLFITELCIWKYCIIDMQGQNHPGCNSTDVNSLTPRKNFLCRMQTVFMKDRETLQYGFFFTLFSLNSWQLVDIGLLANCNKWDGPWKGKKEQGYGD